MRTTVEENKKLGEIIAEKLNQTNGPTVLMLLLKGLTTKETIGAKTALTLDESVKRVQEICDFGKSVNPDILVICHGGPIAIPKDAAYVLERTERVVGFFGASSIERIPTEIAIKEQVESFKSIKL